MYRAIVYFTDLEDRDHPYQAGDPFPRKGLEVSEERIAELISTRNKRGIPVIEEIKEAPKRKLKHDGE